VLASGRGCFARDGVYALAPGAHPAVVRIDRRGHAQLLAIDCRRGVTTIARRMPKVEGGLAVAPRSFGRFGGDLIAPDENSGRIYAVDARGDAHLVTRSGLPHGGDIGVESAGFVPAAGATARLADRGTPGNPHPGTDSVLELTVTSALVRPGDLLVATEGGAQTIAIHCGARCSARHVADGPAIAHAEGHIVF